MPPKDRPCGLGPGTKGVCTPKKNAGTAQGHDAAGVVEKYMKVKEKTWEN